MKTPRKQTPRKPIDPHEIAAVSGDSWYTVRDVARLFRRHERTVGRLIATGKIPAVADPLTPSRHLVQGHTILEMALPLLVNMAGRSQPETKAQRQRRCNDAIEATRRMRASELARREAKTRAADEAILRMKPRRTADD